MELYQIAKGPQALCEVETHLPIGTPQCTGSQTKLIRKRGTGDCEAEYVARNEKAFTGRNHWTYWNHHCNDNLRNSSRVFCNAQI